MIIFTVERDQHWYSPKSWFRRHVYRKLWGGIQIGPLIFWYRKNTGA